MNEILKDAVERFRKLFDVLDFHFILMLIFTEHILQGFFFGGGTGGLLGIPIMYLFRSYGSLTASRMQILKTIAVSPWALKPLFGMLSDSLYIAGYNRMPLILLTIIGSVLSCSFIAFTWPISPVSLTLFLFINFLQIALIDLLIEARYTEVIAIHSSVGPDLMSFIHMGSMVTQIFSILLTGLLVTYMPLQFIYLLPLPFLLFLLYPVYQNWLGDKAYEDQDLELNEGTIDKSGEWVLRKRTIRRYDLTNVFHQFAWYRVKNEYFPLVGFNIQKLLGNWRIFTLGLLVTLLSLTTTTIGLFDISSVYLFVASMVGTILMILAFFLLIDQQIARIQAFVIIQNMFTLSLESATFFFYVDGEDQYPEGPHFSNFFYITVMGIIGTLLAFLGVVTYNLFMTKWSYRKILIITNLLLICASVPNIFFFLRWNRYLLIPDWVFVIGCESLQVVTYVWSSLPLSIIMLQLCPQNMEATVYALLAGSSNLGNSLAQYQGAFILDLLNIRPTGALNESSQFDNLWIAVTIATFLPLIPILFIPLLIPDATQTSKLIK
jgi:MFS family permease